MLLLPRLAALKLYDISKSVRPAAKARPKLLLQWRKGKMENREKLRETPEWARPIVAAALAAEAQPKG